MNEQELDAAEGELIEQIIRAGLKLPAAERAAFVWRLIRAGDKALVAAGHEPGESLAARTALVERILKRLADMHDNTVNAIGHA